MNLHPEELMFRRTRSPRVDRRFAALLGLIATTACAGGADTTVPPAPGLPEPPREVHGVAGDGEVTLSWLHGPDGGSPLIAHRIQADPPGPSVRVDVPGNSTVISGLANSTTYTFTVTAINGVGESRASAPSPAVTPTRKPMPPPSPGRWLVGYYVGYQRGLQPEDDIDFSLLTHLIIGRVVPTTSGALITNFDIDAVTGPEMARRVAALARAAGRPPILMVGGAGARAGFVGAAADANRATFVANLLVTMDALGFAGLDIDWEPVRQEDRAPLLALLGALRSARPDMLITLPVEWTATPGAGPGNWIADAATLVDQVNIMSYGMSGRWPGWQSWHSSALLGHGPAHPSSVTGTVQAYLDAGVPAARLGVGISFSGSCWRGVTGPRQNTTGAAWVAGDNIMSYVNIMAHYAPANARRWDPVAQVPYLSHESPAGPAGCSFVSYEDQESIRAKGALVRELGLGGAMVWTTAQGHVGSAPAGARDPLLRAAWAAVVDPEDQPDG